MHMGEVVKECVVYEPMEDPVPQKESAPVEKEVWAEEEVGVE